MHFSLCFISSTVLEAEEKALDESERLRRAPETTFLDLYRGMKDQGVFNQ